MGYEYKVLKDTVIKGDDHLLMIDRPYREHAHDPWIVIIDKVEYKFARNSMPDWLLIHGKGNFTGKTIIVQ